MIIAKDCIRRIVSESELEKYLRKGYVVVEQKKVEKPCDNDMTLAELKAIAKEKGIKGYSRMSKAEIISLVKNH